MGGMARCVLDPRTNQWVALVGPGDDARSPLHGARDASRGRLPTGAKQLGRAAGEPALLDEPCIDVIFIADMILQFFLAYKTEDVREGTRWIVEPKKIAWHYLCSFWFPLDLFCVLTLLFDVLGDEGTKALRRCASQSSSNLHVALASSKEDALLDQLLDVRPHKRHDHDPCRLPLDGVHMGGSRRCSSRWRRGRAKRSTASHFQTWPTVA